jgi:TonB family protein
MQRGELYLKMGWLDQGKSDLTQGISSLSNDIPRVTDLVPRQPYYSGLLAGEYNSRAWGHHLLGEDAIALPDAIRAVELSPKDDFSLETRAEIYEKLGRREEAIADYRASLALVKNKKEAQRGLERLGDVSCTSPGLVVTPIPRTHMLPPYPVEAQRRHEQGTTVVLVNIGGDGTPTNLAIAQSSGSGRLDDAVAKFGQSYWRWQPPTQDCKPTTAQVHVRVVWRQFDLGSLPPNPDFKVTMPPAAYPPGAVGKLEDGTTLLDIDVDKHGAVTDGRVILTSGFADLDDQALAIVKHSPGLMKDETAGKHVLSALWALPQGTLPPDYETMLVSGFAITSISVGPSP